MREPASRLGPVPGKTAKSLLAFVLAGALAGCGGGEDGNETALDSRQAIVLQDNLTQVENNFSSGRCEDAEAAAGDLVQSVNALPAEVGEQVKANLRGMAENLATLAAEQCTASEPVEEPSPSTSTTSAPPVTTESTSSTTTDTETETETDTAEEPEEDPTEEPPAEPGPSQTPPGQAPGGGPGQGNGGIGATGGFSEDERR